jgi:hypothetical protein
MRLLLSHDKGKGWRNNLKNKNGLNSRGKASNATLYFKLSSNFPLLFKKNIHERPYKNLEMRFFTCFLT